jgi:hypothetical protein
MLIWTENSALTLPVMEAVLSTMSSFPGNTRDFRINNVGGLLFYKATTAGGEQCGVRLMRYIPAEMTRQVGHLLECKMKHPTHYCCLPSNNQSIRIDPGSPRAVSKIRVEVQSITGKKHTLYMVVDTACYRSVFTWTAKTRLGLPTTGLTEEAVTVDRSLMMGTIHEVRLYLVDKEGR